MLKLEREPRWLFTQDLAYNRSKKIVLMYFVNGIPFTFDDIDDMGSIEFSMETANGSESYTLDDIYKGSSYLMAEEAHPCLFDVKVDNPELLPTDY